LTDRSRRERTIGGLAGRFVGKARAALASGQVGEREASADVAPRLAADRQAQAATASARPDADADAQAQAQAERTSAQRSAEAAEQVRVAATEEANRLAREARETERVKQERKLD
jgi:hypothetical protein